MVCSILVVEDEADNAAVLRMVLEGTGHVVLVAWDAGSARTLLASEPTRLALVILDVILPDGTGLDLLREVRAARPALPVVMVSASADQAMREAAARDGASAFLPKPFEPEDLEAAVERFVTATCGDPSGVAAVAVGLE